MLIASCSCLLLAASVTVSAQDAEWRQGGRVLYMTGGATSQEVGDTGASLELAAGIGLEYVAVARFSEMFSAEFAVGATAQELTAIGDDICCGGIDGGRVWLFPLTALGQFHIPIYGNWDPYVGLGVVWTVPYYKLSNDLKNTEAEDIDFKSKVGLAAQAGFNYSLNNRWYANFDARYLGVSLEAKVRLDDSEVDTVDLDIKPWVIGFGFGYRF
ncbi:MAG: OmpW family outer membrane protein [Acidobacteriota bacterium]|nr:OmpW family outer membrane protein [Acidobacteriota bacterium]